MNSFYSINELKKIKIRSFGKYVKISKKASIYNPELLIIGDRSRIDDFSILTGDIKIGSNVHIGPFCGLFGKKGIVIQDFVSISSRVSLYTESDDYVMGISLTNPTIPDDFRIIYNYGKIILYKHVIIGTNTTIMPDVTIKEGASIGAYCFVTKNIDAWTVNSGMPLKKIGLRRNDKIFELEKKYINSLL